MHDLHPGHNRHVVSKAITAWLLPSVNRSEHPYIATLQNLVNWLVTAVTPLLPLCRDPLPQALKLFLSETETTIMA